MASSDDDLTHLAAGQLHVVGADNAHLGMREGPTGGAASHGIFVVSGEEASCGRSELGHAVDLGVLAFGSAFIARPRTPSEIGEAP